MNGAPSSAQPPTQPQPQGVAPPRPADHASSVPMLQTSNALLRGAQSLKALIETRTAAVRAEYEERIRVLTHERDALLAATRALDDPAGNSSNAELIILRGEREVWEQQRAMWEAERAKWMEERAAIAHQQDEDAKRRLEAEDQARRLRAELLRLGADNVRLTALASSSRLPDGAGPSDGFGMSDLEDHFDLTPYMSSPTSSTTLPSLSASSTLSTISSPPHDPVHMEVRSPPLLPFPFDSCRFSTASAPASPPSPGTWLDAQLDPPSPTITARSSDATLSTNSPTPGLSSDNATRSTSPTPGLSSDTAMRSTPPSDDATSLFGSRASSAQASVVPRKLVIRMPASEEPMRTPIKPRPSILPGEKMEVVHVPRCDLPDEDDEDEFMITL